VITFKLSVAVIVAKPVSLFHPSLIFAFKARAYQSGSSYAPSVTGHTKIMEGVNNIFFQNSYYAIAILNKIANAYRGRIF